MQPHELDLAHRLLRRAGIIDHHVGSLEPLAGGHLGASSGLGLFGGEAVTPHETLELHLRTNVNHPDLIDIPFAPMLEEEGRYQDHNGMGP